MLSGSPEIVALCEGQIALIQNIQKLIQAPGLTENELCLIRTPCSEILNQMHEQHTAFHESLKSVTHAFFFEHEKYNNSHTTLFESITHSINEWLSKQKPQLEQQIKQLNAKIFN